MTNKINLTWEELTHFMACLLSHPYDGDLARVYEVIKFSKDKSGPINIVEEEKKQKKCPLCGCEEICYITKFGEPEDRCSNCNADWPYEEAEEI